MSYRDDRQEIKAEDYLNHMRYQPDVAQRNVICHDDDGLLYVNAGPGSGKTKTLVHRKIHRHLQKVRWNSSCRRYDSPINDEDLIHIL